jgi:dTDP-4-amino-4,6-dideoxygalactose transaminase
MIPITRPLMGEAEAEAARRAILSGWTTQGPEVAAFEREFARHVGAPHACAVSNCTAALHLAMLALGIRAGDEVITVSHTFIATANAVRYCGATPVFVDIEPDSFNIDPVQVAAAITPRTRAILCVHQMGMPCAIDRLVELGRRHGLVVIEDAACAAGSEVLSDGRWERIGRPRGDIACFSFHPRKLINTGDGGMLTTRNAALDREFRLLRQHAMNVPDTLRHGSAQVIFESYATLGFNYRLTDIQAAVGRLQLERLPQMVASRRALADRYAELLTPIEGLGLPTEPPWARSNWQSYCVRLPAHCDQHGVMQALLDQGVSTRRGIMCCHREPAYRHLTQRHPLPNSEQAQDRCILLPIYAQMTPGEQQQVAAALAEACSCGTAGATRPIVHTADTVPAP